MIDWAKLSDSTLKKSCLSCHKFWLNRPSHLKKNCAHQLGNHFAHFFKEKSTFEQQKILENLTYPYTIHVWYIYLHEWLIFMVNVGKPRKSKDQTLPISSRESFTWIIPKTILCLVLDFQGRVNIPLNVPWESVDRLPKRFRGSLSVNTNRWGWCGGGILLLRDIIPFRNFGNPGLWDPFWKGLFPYNPIMGWFMEEPWSQFTKWDDPPYFQWAPIPGIVGPLSNGHENGWSFWAYYLLPNWDDPPSNGWEDQFWEAVVGYGVGRFDFRVILLMVQKSGKLTGWGFVVYPIIYRVLAPSQVQDFFKWSFPEIASPMFEGINSDY